MNALSATASSAAASGAGAAGSHYNPAAVMTAAHAQLAAGDWEGGQFLFQSSLLEWTDDVREGGAGESSTTTAISAEEEQQREAIATLWLGYAQYLVDAKQYKSATRAYDDAMKATKAVGRVHAAAALYALERNQRQTAIRIYRNALVGNTNTNNNSTAAAAAVQDEHDREILWRDFLHMMQESHPNLTMAELQASASTAAAEFGVVAENDNATPTIGATTGSASSSNTIPNHTAATATTEWNQNDTVDRNNNTSTNITNNVNDTDDSRQPPGKRIKLWQSENTNNEPRGNGTALPSGTTDNTTTKTHVVTYESVQELQQEYQTKVFLCRNNNTGLENQTQPHHPSSSSSDPPFSLPPDVMAAWMSRDGHGLPLEPPSPSLFGPSPPKLSDPVRISYLTTRHKQEQPQAAMA